MMNSLKTKLIAGMVLLLIVAFGLASILLIQQKKQELSMDVFFEVKSFSDLAAPSIVEVYEHYLAEDSFVYFNREIQGLFDKTQEVVGIGLAAYDGEILYDSSEEEARQYTGEVRQAPESMLERIQATYPSYELDDGRVVYLRANSDGGLDFLNVNDENVASISSEDRIETVIYPYNARYAVLYAPSYDLLEARVQAMWMKIVLLALFSILVGAAYAYFFSTGITRPIKKLRAGAEKLGAGELGTRVVVKARDEVGVLAKTFNQMAVDLEKSMDARVYQEKMSHELELAANIQQDLLPKNMPKIPGLDVSAGIIPATEVGGDIYDFIQVDAENYYGYVGDVTGHGVPAGLLVSVTSALIHSYAHLKDAKQILIEANKILKDKTGANMFVTLVLWHFSIKTGKLNLVSAGHEVALKYAIGPPNKTDELEKGGIALGMMPDITPLMKDQFVEIGKGDSIILYTDGIPEAWRNEKEQYGMPEFKRVVTQSGDLPSAEAIKNTLLADVKQWTKGYEQKDDMTVMVLKRT